MQDAYDEYCKIVRLQYSDAFWRLLSSVYKERVGIIDRVLKITRDIFVSDKTLKKRFATSVRAMKMVTEAAAGNFTSHIMHEICVDLRNMQLPGHSEPFLKFRFINPLWAWIQAANDMVAAGKTMFFKPQTMLNETGERLYGAGVQFGDALKFAATRTPRDRKPTLFGVWYQL